jgi:hypothetical protein
MCDPPLEATARFRLLAGPPRRAPHYGTYTVIKYGSATVPAGAITKSSSVATLSHSPRPGRPAALKLGPPADAAMRWPRRAYPGLRLRWHPGPSALAGRTSVTKKSERSAIPDQGRPGRSGRRGRPDRPRQCRWLMSAAASSRSPRPPIQRPARRGRPPLAISCSLPANARNCTSAGLYSILLGALLRDSRQQRTYFSLPIPTVTTKGPDRCELSGLGPSRDGLRVHPEHCGDLGRRK